MLILALWACSTSQLQPKGEVLKRPPPTSQQQTNKATQRRKRPSAEPHCSAVVTAWQRFVENGCLVEQLPKPHLATTLRVLRNTPYAREHHPFKDRNLTAFFENTVVGCNGKPWYTANTPVTLSGEELRCVNKLSVVEKAAKSHHDSEALQAALLSQAGQGLEDDIARETGAPPVGYHLLLRPSAHPGQIGLTFDYRGQGEDGTEWESAIIVTCDGEDCTVLHAG